MQKKIIFLVPNLFYGGASKVITLIANHLNPHLYKIILVAVNGENNFYNIDSTHISYINLYKKQVKAAVLPIIQLIRKEKADIVFSNGQDLNILLTVLKPLFFNKNIRLICRETSVLSANNKNIKKGKLYNWLVKKFYNNANVIICQSLQMKNDFCNNYNIRLEILKVIPNPVDEATVAPIENAYSTNGLKLLAIGRLVPEKGFLRLLKAVSYLPENWQLVILGDGPQMDELKSESEKLGIHQKVIFTGIVKNTSAYIAACDFVLTGTYNEGFPNVILEAGLQGKPVIAFKVPGVGEEVIEDAVTGVLVKETDEKKFANAIINAQTINFSPLEIKEKIITRFGIKKVIEEYEQLFELLTKKNQN